MNTCTIYVDASYYELTHKGYYCVVVNGGKYFGKINDKLTSNNHAEQCAFSKALEIIINENLLEQYDNFIIYRDSQIGVKGRKRVIKQEYRNKINSLWVKRNINEAGKFLERIPIRNIMRIDNDLPLLSQKPSIDERRLRVIKNNEYYLCPKNACSIVYF